MQSGLTETPNREFQTSNAPHSQRSTSQYGPSRSRSSLPDAHFPLRARSTSSDAQRSAGDPVGGQFDQQPGRLNVAEDKPAAGSRLIAAGQRIADYENAATHALPRQNSRPALSFKVINSSPSDGVQLTDFPNEILTQILSHLHPDSHGAVALVSKRFYALVTTPYAWRAAFLRYFAGHDALAASKKLSQHGREVESSDVIRSEARYFTRLTALASWRSEYLLRTRLLRSLVRGKPGSIGASTRSSQSGKKANAVLTYNSKLPWMISTVHADFSGGKKGPRVIHGTADLGVATVSDPTTGRVEKWGLDDPFSFQQLDEVFPDLDFWGIGEGPAALPNVMDVSQPYGLVGGEGFPGGRVYFKATGQLRGRYLRYDNLLTDTMPEIPKIPELTEAISSVWIAKSSNVMTMTQSMVGIMAGSTLGVVTSYALGHESAGPRYGDGDMTARWVLSPGVPIIDIKVDDQYCRRRKALGRVWAVALNALGEVYYLTEVPTSALKGKAENIVRDAWHAGRATYWELIESTRRTAQPDEFDKNAVHGTYSPRSSADSMGLSREQIAAEAREIEEFFRLPPAHFRKACQGWDMLRKLEVDFAAGDENGAGEAIFVITHGHEDGERASVRRFVKGGTSAETPNRSGALTPVAHPAVGGSSIFGGKAAAEVSEAAVQAGMDGIRETSLASGLSTPRLESMPARVDIEEWRCSECLLKRNPNTSITASAIDMSTFAVMAAFEDPLHSGSQVTLASPPSTPTSKHATGEIPGRRARFLAIGTNAGSIIVWNMRDTASPVVNPVRVIQTESPEVTSLAVSALYLVHGGSDSLVQAWDPLASSLEPIRTLNAKSSGRIPRHILNANPALQHASYFAVRAIFLDPDPTVLRGILAFGTFLRFWTYSSTNQAPGRKRRLRHSDIHGRLASRRHGGAVSSYIAAEEAELRHEQEHRSREINHLRKRFGVGFGELTEEEAIQYAQMISEESFLLDEQRRLSASDTGSGADAASSTGSLDTITPEPSVSENGATGPSVSVLPPVTEEGTDDDYEAQIQRAIRLSLMEGVSGAGESPNANRSGEYEFQIVTRSKDGKGKGKGRSSSKSPSESASIATPAHVALGREAGYEAGSVEPLADLGVDVDDDLALALRLSLEEEEARQKRASQQVGVSWNVNGNDDYPPLENNRKGTGKGKWA
ncbi:F-box/WD repeat-containing protein pof10 [Madurella mycetomatis]|uniref:F-box/WD repeat-containing protein pof10 n=1 Tax=Madurella mycetomatis TaxID=100816 RepID=A0A150AS85_9PEZI|nr:F-box/WD repeat-containing protein pof10 [Madurella mycetomatis]